MHDWPGYPWVRAGECGCPPPDDYVDGWGSWVCIEHGYLMGSTKKLMAVYDAEFGTD
jgi:hypothetical protein